MRALRCNRQSGSRAGGARLAERGGVKKRRSSLKWKARPAPRPALGSPRFRLPGPRVRIFAIIALIAGALFCAARAPFAQQEPARIALLIGNQSYEPSVGALKNPHNDIALLSRALERQGYTVLPLVKDATRTRILAAGGNWRVG